MDSFFHKIHSHEVLKTVHVYIYIFNTYTNSVQYLMPSLLQRWKSNKTNYTKGWLLCFGWRSLTAVQACGSFWSQLTESNEGCPWSASGPENLNFDSKEAWVHVCHRKMSFIPPGPPPTQGRQDTSWSPFVVWVSGLESYFWNSAKSCTQLEWDQMTLDCSTTGWPFPS